MLISIIKSCCLFPLFHSPLPLALAHTHTHSMLRVWSYYCKKLLNIHTISTLPFSKCIHFISLLACFVMIFFSCVRFFLSSDTLVPRHSTKLCNEGLFIKKIRIQFKFIRVVHRQVINVVIFFSFTRKATNQVII